MLPSLPLLQLGEFKLEQMQKNVVGAINNIVKNPFLDGVLLTQVSLSASPSNVAHKLKRDYQGFIITNINANANVWVSATTEKASFIKLTASANCIVDIWVF